MVLDDNSGTDIHGHCNAHGTQLARRCKACDSWKKVLNTRSKRKWRHWNKLEEWERDHCLEHRIFVRDCPHCATFQVHAQKALA